MKICIVSSCGGHLGETRQLRAAYQHYTHFYVINDTLTLPDDMKGRTYFITHSERDWRFFINLLEAYSILRREQPKILLSTGAGPIVPFAIIARLFWRAHVIFVETISRTDRPSMTGRLMYWLASDFYYHWPNQRKYFPRGTYGGHSL